MRRSWIYAENDVQRALLAEYRKLRPLVELQAEAHARFGAGLADSDSESAMWPLQKEASITERDDRRVTAEYIDGNGHKGTLYLVEMDGTWWFSGYTLEYQFPGLSVDEVGELPNAEVLDPLASVSRKVLQRLRSGEFDTIEELRLAFGLTMLTDEMPRP